MKIKIYNINSEFANEEAEKGNYYSFMSSESLERHGLSIDRCNYDLVWDHEFIEPTTPDKLFVYFNDERPRPADFNGHSLSVSDVVVLDGKAYYCDSIGWKELPEHWDSGISSIVQDKCNLCECPDACRYGCKSDYEGRKIANDGVGITAMVDDNGKVIIYFNDIMNCKKWYADR